MSVEKFGFTMMFLAVSEAYYAHAITTAKCKKDTAAEAKCRGEFANDVRYASRAVQGIIADKPESWLSDNRLDIAEKAHMSVESLRNLMERNFGTCNE